MEREKIACAFSLKKTPTHIGVKEFPLHSPCSQEGCLMTEIVQVKGKKH